MPKTSPTVKHLIEALQLADFAVRRVFSVVGACRLGPSRADDLGYLIGRRAPSGRTALRGVCPADATLLLA